MPQSAKPFRQRDIATPDSRANASARGYNWRWRKASKAWLGLPENIFCVHCAAVGRETLGAVVDHKIPHRGDQDLFWDEGNWQSLCSRCHNRKTANGG